MKFVLFFVFAVSFLISSCRFVESHKIQGDGHMTKSKRSVAGFTGVETHGSIDLVLVPGDYSVVVESDENILPFIVTEVVDQTLRVHFEDKFGNYSYTSATVYISAPSLHVFGTHGSGNINSNGKFTASDKSEVTVGGSGDIKLDLNSPAVEARISGSGNISLAGETKDFSSEINGSGDIRAFELRSETVSSTVHGSGNTEVSAAVKLDAEIYGSGDVNYRGTPQISSSIHGSGALNRAN